jgi:acetoin:2,6-dichlorophenolindophenol oxidoreductase subunit beta
MAIGAAMCGTRAIVDNVFMDFSFEAMPVIAQQAATLNYVSNGKIKVPVLIRGAMGSVRSAGAQHSHTVYAWFAHLPGLKVAVPSTPFDVKGLMKSALREDCPVVFAEHKALYNTKGMIPDTEFLVPFGQARICREGSNLTIVAVGAMVRVALDAARVLEADGISVEVVDPRTIVPLDRKTIANSICKTGRVVSVDEAPSMCGFSGEVCAIACEECFDDLDAPPKRICSLPIPNPFSPVLENSMIPDVKRVVSEVRQYMKA